MSIQNQDLQQFYKECENHFKELIKNSEIIKELLAKEKKGIAYSKSYNKIYEIFTSKLRLALDDELSDEVIEKLELDQMVIMHIPDTDKHIEITRLEEVNNNIKRGLSIHKLKRILTGETLQKQIFWLLFAEGIPTEFWSHTAFLVEEWGCKRNPKCTKTFDKNGDEGSKSDSLLHKLEKQHVILYFNKKVDSRFYRTFLYFKEVDSSSGRKYDSIEVDYCGENERSLKGKAFLDEHYNLIIMLHSEEGRPHQTFTWRGVLDKYLSDENFEETVMVGVRTINAENTQDLYSGMAILRLPSKKIFEERFKTKEQREPQLIKDLEPTDHIEKKIILHLSFVDSYKISQFTTPKQLDTANNTNRSLKGRQNFVQLLSKNLHLQDWVALNRVVDDPDEEVAISYVKFEVDDLAQKVKVTRTSKDFSYEGEVQLGGQDRLWFNLSDIETRKFILAVPVGDMVLCMGTYANKTDGEMLMFREIMIPASKMSAKTKEDDDFRILYDSFVNEVDLKDEYKTYLSSRSASILSFPDPKIESTNYGKKLMSSLYEGQYFLYLFDRGKGNGSLLQFTLKIDSLGNAEYRKSTEIKVGRNRKKIWFQYRGESFLFSKTLMIQSEHIMDNDKDFKSKDEISKQQNPQLSFIIDKEQDQDGKPTILFGQISDTDKNGLPDCSACIAISADLFKRRRFLTGEVKGGSPHYKRIEKAFKTSQALKKLNENLDKEIRSLEDFFDVIGHVQFRS